MDVWEPNRDQLTQWNEEGYFILRGVVPCDLAYDMRGVIKNEIMKPEPSGSPDKDPMDPMGDSPEAKASRFRKLGNFLLKFSVNLAQFPYRKFHVICCSIFFRRRHNC